jgi:hypothetical protein
MFFSISARTTDRVRILKSLAAYYYAALFFHRKKVFVFEVFYFFVLSLAFLLVCIFKFSEVLKVYFS